ncbi:cucurbitadienol 11-hydroxylase [Eucalyptus grandis]|nr:cucurbitadienol 11-hydroxylase [Eucalyptus grandis]
MRFPMVETAMGLVALIVFASFYWKYKWRDSSNFGKLPPGSMGLPFLGETIQFFIPSKSIDLPPFLKKRIKRYGTLFKTSLAGRPVVISTDPEFNKYVLLQEGKLVELWYLDSLSKLVGHDSPDLEVKTNATGYVHKHLRYLILNHMGPESLKGKLLRQLEATAERTLDAWSTQQSVEAKHGCSKMIFEFTSKLLLGYDAEKSGENLTEDLRTLMNGLMSLPINIPGTTFHKSLKSQKKLLNMIQGKIAERMASPAETREADVLDHVLEDMKTKSFLSEKFVTYIFMGLLIASFESITSALVMALILLTDSPQVVDELVKEQQDALHKRSSGAIGMTWEEYKSMPYTMQVVNESLRLTSSGPGIMRRAIKDIEWNGYVIPKGWTIFISQSGVHLNPQVFENPHVFDPSRWKQLDGGNVTGRYYIPFGGGGRQCAGAEFSKALCAVFLQVLVTKYRWTKVKGGEIIRTPMLKIGGGFHIKVSKIQE